MGIAQYAGLGIVVLAIFLLIKKAETRMVLIGAGILLCALAKDPLIAFNTFGAGMVNDKVVPATCASMGFAFVMKYTGCDVQLVRVLAKLMSKLGILLVPATVLVTLFVNSAIISAAGCAAAIGATLIPLLIAARIHPAIAGAAVLSGTFGSLLSPGLGHNPFVGEMAGMTAMEVVRHHAPFTITAGAIAAITLTVVTLLRKEFNVTFTQSAVTSEVETPQARINPLKVIAPFLPLVVLLIGSFTTWYGDIKISVATAMLLGCIFAMIVSLVNPGEISNSFFKGVGSAYADIIGLIIAAAIFAEGLKASGLVGEFIELLKNSNEFARWGGTIGPFLMAVITGSGEAAAYAFNGAVTPHAKDIGFEVVDLGMAAALAAALGRTMSPVAGVVIVCAGLANISPVELVKRTAPGMIIAVLFVATIML